MSRRLEVVLSHLVPESVRCAAGQHGLALSFSAEVAEALKMGRPVVALESTIITHGMAYPANYDTAIGVEEIVRKHGAEPATIAIIGGQIHVGLSKEQILYLAKTGTTVTKCSRRDIASCIARRIDGATTVSATLLIGKQTNELG